MYLLNKLNSSILPSVIVLSLFTHMAYADREVSTGWTVKSVGLTADTFDNSNFPYNTVYAKLVAPPATACADANNCACTNLGILTQTAGEPKVFSLTYSANHPFVVIRDKDIWKMLWAQLNTAASLGRKVDITFVDSAFCNIYAVQMQDV